MGGVTSEEGVGVCVCVCGSGGWAGGNWHYLIHFAVLKKIGL